jgi:hypothetical protein
MTRSAAVERRMSDAHARFLRGDVAYPDDVREQIETQLDYVTNATGRGEITEAVEAVFAVQGIHDDWLFDLAGEGNGDA